MWTKSIAGPESAGTSWRYGHSTAFAPLKTLWEAIEAVKEVKGGSTERAAAWWMKQQQKPGPDGKPGPLSTLGKVGLPHIVMVHPLLCPTLKWFIPLPHTV